MPSAISRVATSVSFLKGAEPFREKSYSVNVSEGKWLKKDNLALEKFTSPSRLLLVQFLIFSATVPGNTIGARNSSNSMLQMERPVILNSLVTNFFAVSFTLQR